MLSWAPTCVVQIEGDAASVPLKSLRHSRSPTSDRLYTIPVSSAGSGVPFESTPTPKMIRWATARAGGAGNRNPPSRTTLSAKRHFTVPADNLPPPSRAIEYRIPNPDVNLTLRRSIYRGNNRPGYLHLYA